jgi:hypothetical protein
LFRVQTIEQRGFHSHRLAGEHQRRGSDD